MTTIAKVDNHSFWAREYEMDPADPIAILRTMLETWVLDPTFETYGNFVSAPPVVNTRGELIHPEAPEASHLFGNFDKASCVFDIYTDDPVLLDDLTSRIRANQASPEYIRAKEARKERMEQQKLEIKARAVKREIELRRQLEREHAIARREAGDGVA